MNFFVCITTIKKYDIALQTIINSLPKEWQKNYILVYNNEPKNDYKMCEDGHIEVYITNNLFDYGNWVGVNLLLEANVVPQNSWFLFVHDTCKFSENSADLTQEIIVKYNNSDTDILWLCDTGQCNICLIKKNGIQYGNTLYKDIQTMIKAETIIYEWKRNNRLSPKSFKVNQEYIKIPTTHLGKRDVYNTNVIRDILWFKSINMEKYYCYVKLEEKIEHKTLHALIQEYELNKSITNESSYKTETITEHPFSP
jgi:hypothetical protein